MRKVVAAPSEFSLLRVRNALLRARREGVYTRRVTCNRHTRNWERRGMGVKFRSAGACSRFSSADSSVVGMAPHRVTATESGDESPHSEAVRPSIHFDAFGGAGGIQLKSRGGQRTIHLHAGVAGDGVIVTVFEKFLLGG